LDLSAFDFQDRIGGAATHQGDSRQDRRKEGFKTHIFSSLKVIGQTPCKDMDSSREKQILRGVPTGVTYTDIRKLFAGFCDKGRDN
jgi:hypothetical protein